MLFSSVPFLFYFLPAALLIYFAAPRQLKNAVLLLASLFFYAWGEPKYMLLMLVSIVQGYGFGLLIEKHRGQKASKVFLTLSILVSLGLLGYFKYADFFLSSVNAVTGLSLPLLKLSLPIGISFYTFQVLSYVIDVYRGETAAQRNFIDLAAYVSLFPQLIAGPIVRYSDVAAELKSRTHSVSAAAEGVRRFTVGFAKKILLANQFGALASAYKSTQDASVLFVWLYALAFLLQVYFDFSGYSDMAIGLGRMLGFHFPENFNYPYISASITEFWRRWHMSLGSWFRDYLYIPLGGSRKGKARQLLNILIVWLATGLWHGAAWTFVLWGLWFAVLLLLEKLALLPVLEKHRVLGHVYTLFFVTLGFVLFDADSAAQAVSRIGAMLGAGGLPLSSTQAVYYLKKLWPAARARYPLRNTAAEDDRRKAAQIQRRSDGARCARAAVCTDSSAARHGIFSGRVVQPVPLLPLLRRASHESKNQRRPHPRHRGSVRAYVRAVEHLQERRRRVGKRAPPAQAVPNAECGRSSLRTLPVEL